MTNTPLQPDEVQHWQANLDWHIHTVRALPVMATMDPAKLRELMSQLLHALARDSLDSRDA